jgi:uncharacterized membrane protein YdjX (TVP38/TMEM64 family)
MFVAGVVIYSAYDWNYVLSVFERFIDWVQVAPLTSSLAIIGIYVFLVIFTFPILYLTIALGYAYTKAWSQKSSSLSELIGEHSLTNTIIAFTCALFLITFAVMLGALIAFLISRYWLGKTIKKRVLRNHRSFAAVDSVVT